MPGSLWTLRSGVPCGGSSDRDNEFSRAGIVVYVPGSFSSYLVDHCRFEHAGPISEPGTITPRAIGLELLGSRMRGEANRP